MRSTYFLGSMGSEDLANFINAETRRVPFKQATMSLSDWKGTFRSWPSKIPGWRNCYLHMLDEKKANWEDLRIDHYIRLSLTEMEKNESLLATTMYFWSDALNAFLFN